MGYITVKVDIEDYKDELCEQCEYEDIVERHQNNVPAMQELKYLADCVSIGESNAKLIEKMLGLIAVLKH